VTNNSTKSRAGYLKKFTGLGLNVAAEEIYSSSYAAAAYLESIKFPQDKKVYVVGEVSARRRKIGWVGECREEGVGRGGQGETGWMHRLGVYAERR